jgi:hypothetical protein
MAVGEEGEERFEREECFTEREEVRGRETEISFSARARAREG